MNPLVSIIIPTLNRSTSLKSTLESVIEQNYEDWECLVIDDGSEENQLKEVERLCKKDGRLKLFSRPDNGTKGASACRNYGYSKCNGDLIQFLDDDDLLHKNKLLEQVRLHIKKDDTALLTCRWGGFTNPDDLESRFKYKYHCYRNFRKGADLLGYFGLYNEYFPVHVYLTPRILVDLAGPWNEDLNNNDDAEFFTRVVLNAPKILFSKKAVVYYRYSNSDKLSTLDSIRKINSAIHSWNLIEDHIKYFKTQKARIYYKRAKDNLYNNLKKTRPEVIEENYEFFSDHQIPNFLGKRNKPVWWETLLKLTKSR